MLTPLSGPKKVTAPELHELLAALSLAGDAANGLPFETSLRTCGIALQLAEALGMDGAARDVVWQASVLRFLGCTAYAHEEFAAFGGSDVETRRVFDGVEPGRLSTTLRATWAAMEGTRSAKLRQGARLLGQAETLRQGLATSACDVGRRLADRLGMRSGVSLALAQLYERWDGGGSPDGTTAEQTSLPARVLHVACVFESVQRRLGAAAAIGELRRRSGHHLDPTVVEACERVCGEIERALDPPSLWSATLGTAPATPAETSVDALTAVLADFVDLKAPHAMGHSRRVADLAARAAEELGLDADPCTRLRHAGRVHNLGHIAIGNDVWEQPGSLSSSQWELVRLHPYHGSRILKRSDVLRPFASLTAAHHERLDGSGYPNELLAHDLPLAVRVLSAADVYAALREPRPCRARRDKAEAARTLEAEAEAGRLDVRAVQAVLAVSGSAARRLAPPCGLSDREVEVLTHVAQGASNKVVAERLGISPKTVQHHVRHIYDKANVRSRAAIALFAIEHGLLHLGADDA